MSTHRILVVHADEGVLNAVRRALQDDAHEILVARDGLEGLRRIEETKPSVIIADTMLPDLDGISLVHELRAHSKAPPPVIFLSGRVDTESMLAGLAAGARFYVTLPIDDADLLAKVHRLLND